MHEVRRLLFDHAQRLDAVGRLGDHLHLVNLAQQETQLFPRQLLVVDDDDAERVGESMLRR